MIKRRHLELGVALMPQVRKYLDKYKLSVEKSENGVNNLGVTPELVLSIMIVDMAEQAAIEEDELKQMDSE